jgi:hypothetical protein
MDSIAVSTIDCTRVAEKSISLLNLSHAQLGDEYGYHSLSLCVIDAVFSIGVRYGGVQTVVQNYCSHFSQSRLRSEPSHWPTTEEQIPLSVLCQQFEELGVQHMAEVVFNNRQRTSTRSGISKAEAVWRFAQALTSHHVEYFQDLENGLPDAAVDAIRAIKGQGSGISLEYFLMLAGDGNRIKPDRMVLRFLEDALQRGVTVAEAPALLRETLEILRGDFPSLSLRALDYLIWQWQRQATSADRPPVRGLLQALEHQSRYAFVTRESWERLLSEVQPTILVQPKAIGGWMRVDPDHHSYALKADFAHPEPIQCADGVWRVVTQWDAASQAWIGEVREWGSVRATDSALLAAGDFIRQQLGTEDLAVCSETEAALRKGLAMHPGLMLDESPMLERAVSWLRKISAPDALRTMNLSTQA